jgi:hypothetical protein
MLDHYEEIFEMAQKLGLPQKPIWYDVNGCPRWQEPEKRSKMFVKGIRCQACGQLFRVCLVDAIYKGYGRSFLEHAQFSGKIPRGWHYGDAPAHPTPEHWGPDWWKKGWDVHCMGETMNSIPEYEWECWDFHEKEGKTPIYKKEFLVENDKDDGEEE